MKIIADILVFFVFWSSLFCIGLAMFRFKIINYWLPILISLPILTIIGVLIQKFKIVYLVSIIQPACFFFACFYYLD